MQLIEGGITAMVHTVCGEVDREEHQQMHGSQIEQHETTHTQITISKNGTEMYA